MMPNNAGLILYAPCVMSKVFMDEFRVEMVDCLGKAYWVPPADHPRPDEFGISSWYEGRSEALLVLASEIYASEDARQCLPKLRLKMRTKHHDFGHCDECNGIAEERATIRKNRLGAESLAANNKRAEKHAHFFMGERRALETLRQSIGRGGILFCMRDKCGDDCLYLPSRARQTLSNTSKYQWRMAAQFELYPGKLTQVNLLPANCFAGANFGCTALLSGWMELMDLGLWTKDTKCLILNEDGGSENVNWEKHALIMMAIKHIETLDEIIVARLPSEHHHDWADTTISVLEAALDAPGSQAVETLPDMVHFIQQLFSKSKTYGKSAVRVKYQVASHNFSQLFDGCVDADFSRFGTPHVWRYTRNHLSREPQAQYKKLIQDTGSFYQDEWGPWDEQYVSHTDERGQLQRNVRVLRSTPGGAPFMLSYPDITKDPGLEDWKAAEDWSQEKVFDSLLRTWKYSQETLDTATSTHGPTDSWQALHDFYSSHQTSNTVPTMPVKLTTPNGDIIELAGMPCAGGWVSMWQKLTQFNPRPDDPALPAANPSTTSGASSSTAPMVPRASDVNVVNHTGYNNSARAQAAAKELLSKENLWEKVTDSFSVEPHLFWVALPHFEGELRIGLGAIQLNDLDQSIEWTNKLSLNVEWYKRKAFKPGSLDTKTGVEKGFLWGVQPTFERSIIDYDSSRAPIYEISSCKFGDLLPIPVKVYSKSTRANPKPEQRTIYALIEYCKKYSHNNPEVPLWRSVEQACADDDEQGNTESGCGGGGQALAADVSSPEHVPTEPSSPEATAASGFVDSSEDEAQLQRKGNRPAARARATAPVTDPARASSRRVAQRLSHVGVS